MAVNARDWMNPGERELLQSDDNAQFDRPRHSEKDPVDFVFKFLSTHWLLIVISCVVAGALTSIVELRVPNQYTSRAQIRVDTRDRLHLSELTSAAIASSDPDQELTTELAVINGPGLAYDVVRRLKLCTRAEFINDSQVPLAADSVTSLPETTCVEKFRSGLTVERVLKTNLIDVAYRSASPALAETLANATVDAYIEQGFRSRYESTNRVADWLGTKLDDLRKQVESSQGKLLDAQKRLGVLDPGNTHDSSIYIGRLQSLYQQYAAAQNQTLLLEAEDQMAQGTKVPVILTSYAPSAAAAVTALQAQIDSLISQVSSYRATYGPNYPLVQQATQQLNQAEKQLDLQLAELRTQIHSQYLTAKRNETAVQLAIDKQTVEVSSLSGETIKFSQASQEYDANRLLYQGLLTRLREAGVLAGLSSNSVDILNIARVPVTPSGPNRRLIISAGVALGLLIGCGLGILRDALRTGFKSIEDIEQTVRAPVVGILPRFKHTGGGPSKAPISDNALWVSRNPQSQIAEAFRSLRTAILLSRPNKPPKVLTVTSSIASEGKTTISINLAAVLSQSGARVLLIDADMRRPSLGRRLNLSNRHGLSDFLSGGSEAEAVLQEVPEIAGLKVLSAGPIPPFPAELLGSEKMREAIRKFSAEFDYVVIDNAPILAVTDPTLCALLSDINLLVIRHAGATRAAVVRASEILATAGFSKVALILNSLDDISAKYMGYYGVGQYYKDDDAQTYN